MHRTHAQLRAVLLSTTTRADGSVERVFGAPPGTVAGGAFTCPTGEPCESPKVCKCKGVAADGTVGVGASCECVTIQRVPPGPHRPGRLPPGMRTVPVQRPVLILNPIPYNDANGWEARWHRFLRR